MQNLLFFLLLLLVSSCDFKSHQVDLILHNGRIYTLNQNEDIFKACAIKNGKIVDVGPENHILSKYSANEKIDLQHKTVYPGFTDAHCHFLGLGESLLYADLVGTSSYEDIIDRLTKYESKFSHEWILGRGWDQNDWENQEFPTNEKLNELYPDRPVFLSRIDGHAALVNDVALHLAGITCEVKVEGGKIIQENESCTGVLVDNAMNLVSDLIPQLNTTDKVLALKLAERKCLSAGLTSLHDAGLSFRDILFIDSLHNSGDLKIQIYAMFADSEENYNYVEENGPIKSERITANSFKFYADGALGSRGACLKDPYADSPGDFGLLLSSPEYFQEKAKWLYTQNIQMNTHCIGDSANKVLLDIYKATLKESNDRRWRIEHCQVVDKEDLKKFRDYNIVPSVQPLHATSDFPWFIDRLGTNRVNKAYSNKELLAQTGIVALGTDFPVELHYPLNTFYAAVFRKNIKGKPVSGIQPENALTRLEAVKGMTLWAALASFEENTKGTIEVGKNADFTILDRDILKVNEALIPKTKTEMTFIQGECVFKSNI